MVNDYNDGHQGYESMAEILCSGGMADGKVINSYQQSIVGIIIYLFLRRILYKVEFRIKTPKIIINLKFKHHAKVSTIFNACGTIAAIRIEGAGIPAHQHGLRRRCSIWSVDND